MNYIGIDIGGTTVKLAIVTDTGNILTKWSIPTNTQASGNWISEEIIASVKQQLAHLEMPLQTFLGVGVGVPGSVTGGIVKQAVNLGWINVPLKEQLEKDLKLPVELLNDANAAALGELWQGSAPTVSDMVFVTLGTGVGGGIILNKRILNGAHASGGEIGHIPIHTSEQRTCGCGNSNCLEAYASANGLLQTAQQALAPESVPDTAAVFALAKQGNAAAQNTIKETTTYLGQAIAGILNTVDPQELVIGGGLAEAGDDLLVPLYKTINQYVFPQIRHHVTMRKATVGNDAGILGAVYQVIHKQAS